MFFIAGCYSAEVLDPIEETFDMIALFVKGLGKAVSVFTVGFIGNIGCSTLGAKFTNQVQRWYKPELQWERSIINSILMIG